MSEHGRIIAVTARSLGSSLVADTPAGATSITVYDAAEFDDQDGGSLSINDQVIAYTSVNDDTGVITLAAGLSAAADEGDQVLVYDPLDQKIAVDKRADVVLDGSDDNTDPIDASIALHLVDKLDTGIRGDTGESVLLEEDAGDWRVIDALGIAQRTAVKVLDDLDDVTIDPARLADRKSLAYNAADDQWEPYGPVVLEGTVLPADPTATPWQFFVKHN